MEINELFPELNGQEMRKEHFNPGNMNKFS